MRRFLTVSIVLVVALAVVGASPAKAKAAAVSHWTVSGPFATAFWSTAPETPQPNVVYTDTFIGAFHQLNGPGSRGFFDAGFVDQVTYIYDQDGNWVQLSETYADDFTLSSLTYTAPLRSIKATGTGHLLTCSYWGAPDCVPGGTVTLAATWTGVGAITHESSFGVDVDPALSVHISQGPEEARLATVDPVGDPFDGTMGDIGTFVFARMGDVHFAFIDICHEAGC